MAENLATGQGPERRSGGHQGLRLDTRAVIVAARRTPVGTVGQRLGALEVTELGAAVLRAAWEDASVALERSGARGPFAVADVVLGNCMGPGGNIARVAALAAGLGHAVPGMTIDRQCGSGLAAIVAAGQAAVADAAVADSAFADTADAAGAATGRSPGAPPRLWLAGGAESASTAPLRIARDPRNANTTANTTASTSTSTTTTASTTGAAGEGDASGSEAAYARAPFAPAGFPDPEMGPAAEAFGALRGIGRARQDAYALRGHERAFAAAADGAFDDEIVAVAGLSRDDGPRRMSAATLARFSPAFETGGCVTAGNSCRISDGAAAVAIVPASARGEAAGLAVVASAVVGCDPAYPGLGPVAAVRAVLANAGVRLADVAAIEIVEAFAAQVLAATDELGLSGDGWVDERLCAEGGAIALGHPWGASGAIGVVRLFSRLVRAGAPAGTLGLATAAVGGGMGVAALFEVVR